MKGRVTFDLCGGSFPSERLRTGRFQVGLVPEASVVPNGVTPLSDGLGSVEVVSFVDANAARQGMRELAAARRVCPPSVLVESAVSDEVPMKWRFHGAPDKAWENVPGVQRLAFDVTVTDPRGRKGYGHLIDLSRGNVVVNVSGGASNLDAIAARGLGGEAGLVRTLSDRLTELGDEGVTDS